MLPAELTTLHEPLVTVFTSLFKPFIALGYPSAERFLLPAASSISIHRSSPRFQRSQPPFMSLLSQSSPAILSPSQLLVTRQRSGSSCQRRRVYQFTGVRHASSGVNHLSCASCHSLHQRF